MVEGGMKFIKYTIFCFNLIFFISGIILIAVGGVAHAKFVKYETALEDNYYSPAMLLIVCGIFITLISFFGCYGAFKEIHCMIMTYAVLLGLILILELSAGIAGYVLRGDVNGYLAGAMETQLETKYGNDSTVTDQWNLMQNDLECCGSHNVSDWYKNAWFIRNGSLPESCCTDRTQWAKCSPTQKDSFYPRGCYDALKDEISDNITAVGGVGIGFAFVQLIGIIFACCLARALRAQYETV